ncbi:hypothetical protein [Candidatus Flexifilum breve]|uniref:hypothetical protein n=1 Tax=Candidatus Flexifilum breve TaxID=3140694 RepID=UPI0031CCC843
MFEEFKDRVMIGGSPYSTDPTLITGFYGTESAPEIHLPFNFALLMLPWQADDVRSLSICTRRACPRTAGRTTSSATTIRCASAPASVWCRRASPPC